MTRRAWPFVIVASAAAPGAFADSGDATLRGSEILRKVDDTMNNFDDQTFDNTMRVIEGNGSARERRFRTWQRRGGRRLVRFTAPADVAGTAVLVESRDMTYVYLPGYKRVRRVAGHARSQTFLGSDFTFEDVSDVVMSDKYTAVLTGETADEWMLELRPKSPGETEYARLAMIVSRKLLHYTKLEYFDAAGQKIKTQTEGEFTWFEKDRDWTPGLVTMTDHRRADHRTEVRIKVVATNSRLPDEMFTPRELERGGD